ncbi:hypothetical protein CB1_001970006 [Camelus ferus]|nr:hypothetical protein CB1_001970006 [Camelus ferus]
MSRGLNNTVSSLQRSGTLINSLIAALTIGGQQLFSSFTFKCPCQIGKNFYYGSAFLVIPALILLVAGYALRSQTWTIAGEYCICVPPPRRISLLERKLACLRFFSITGRALVAPLTWLAVTLLTGTYYECAASEFASVDHYPVFHNISASKRKEILAGFPCCKSAPADIILVRDEVTLLHRYQSQHHYWTTHLCNERKLFEQAAEQHSRLLITQRIKKLFGFIPGTEDVKHIRIPSCRDWKDISIPGFLCIGDDLQVLSENPPSFTITVTSEAGENDETVQATLKFTYSEKYPDEAPLYEIFSQLNLEDTDVSDILKLLALQQLFHGTPVTIENFLNWKAKFDAELLEIKKKRMKEEEQAGKNKLSGRQLFETDHNLDTSDIQFLEDAGNNVEVDESLFQEMDDLDLEDDEDDPDYNPADPESDLTD